MCPEWYSKNLMKSSISILTRSPTNNAKNAKGGTHPSEWVIMSRLRSSHDWRRLTIRLNFELRTVNMGGTG